MALAVKEGSRSSNAILRNRIRITRCPTNIFGLLQPYSIFDSNGQNLLYQMNKGDLTERYIIRLTLSQTPANSSSKRKLDNNHHNDEYAPDQRSGRIHVCVLVSFQKRLSNRNPDPKNFGPDRLYLRSSTIIV
jgi:hypothetical protein